MRSLSNFRRLHGYLIGQILALSACSAYAEPLTILVGGDACDHNSIQAAINQAANNPGLDTIRVAMNASYNGQSLNIGSQDLDIIGGYATCATATPTPDATTTINGAGGSANSVLVITGSGTRNLRNLHITGGDETNAGVGGGIDFSGTGELALTNVFVSNNRAGYGGGINFKGTGGAGAILSLGENVVVQNNIANGSGGGIRLDGTARMYMLEGRSTIKSNEARGLDFDSGYGGGLQILPPAQAEIGSPGRDAFGAIAFNTAKYGGGIALRTRSDGDDDAYALLYNTDPQHPVRIHNNTATELGGAVFLSRTHDVVLGGHEESTFFCAYDFRIDHNSAPKGAAMYLAGQFSGGTPAGSLAVLNQPEPQCNVTSLPPSPIFRPCDLAVVCNSIDHNTSTAGATIELEEASFLEGYRLRLTDNSGSDALHGLTSSALFSNCLIANNDVSARLIANDGRTNIINCTLSNNTIGFSDVLSLTGNTLLKDSIIWQPGHVSLGSNHGPLIGSAIITNDPVSLSPLLNVFNSDPRFVDPANRDYHLRAASPGIDASAPDVTSRFDLDGLPRDRDLENANGFGPRDVGAYERPAMQPLVLNSDFLSNVSLWEENGTTPNISPYDSVENVPGFSLGGSMSFDYIPDIVIAGRVTARTQCIHLPVPGTYKLSGFARTTGSPLPNSRQTALLHWELRHDGGETCSGVPNSQGDLLITNGSNWAGPTSPATITISAGPGQFSPNSSISISTVMQTNSATPRPMKGWFDHIQLNFDSDNLFKNSFE